MSDTDPARGRPLLPDMDRLLSVWEDRDAPVTAVEHAAVAFRLLWREYLAEPDLMRIGEWLDSDQPRDTDEAAARIARVIDDEITWALGNRPETVTFLDDDAEDFTVGELIGRITMLAVLLDRWPHDGSEAPMAPAFVLASRDYDHLVADLRTGQRRQPRRRRHGLPPIPRPHPIAAHGGLR